MTTVSMPCGICPSEIGVGAEMCPGCSRPLDDQDRGLLHVRMEGAEHESFARGRRVRQASKWIGALALLFAISAPILHFTQKVHTDKAIENLSAFADDEVLEPLDGKTYTAGQLRAVLIRESYQNLIGNLIVAGLMGALWLWARRSPLPAICCALALFLVVQVGSTLIDPSSITKGLLIKVLAMAALGKGLKAALDARAATQPPAI